MQKIHQLPPHMVARIAAGEVIERASYAVKELIENAIDAKATVITIHIEDAGLKKIQVTDNGDGMSVEDLQESWKPHTTSKITPESSLLGITSLGFRGEALASLAVVSSLTIKSKTQDEVAGSEIVIDQGKFVSLKPVGMPQGTVVVAENLFAHMPARKKFLKSPQTELRHTMDIILSYALSYPAIHFTFIHNKKTLLDFPATKNSNDRIKTFFGTSVYDVFLPLKIKESYLMLSGFIAKPQLHTTSSNKQILFINNRKVSDRLLTAAIKEAYGTMLEPTTSPIFILYLTLPFEMVDVNVHPRKEQVSFLNAQYIFQTVKQIVTETLQNNNITFQNLSWKRTGVGLTNSYAGKMLKETVLPQFVFSKKKSPIVQFYNLYLVTATEAGLLLIDQHGGHERIIFETLKKSFLAEKEKTKSFTLPQPISFSFSPSEMLTLQEFKSVFENLGFQFSFQKKKTLVTHIPLLFQDRNLQELLTHMLNDLQEDKNITHIDKISEEMLAFLACRAAVKAGDELTEEQMHRIVIDLQQTPNNVTCPHGRPTTILLSQEELRSLFHR